MDTNVQQHRIFYEAITNPLEVEDRDLLRLIDKYPFCQPLRYALLRKNSLLDRDVQPVQDTLLYAPAANWLWNYVHTPVGAPQETAEESDPRFSAPEGEKDTLRYEEPALGSDDIEHGQTQISESTDPGAEDDLDSSASEEEALNKLVQGGSVGGDYFAFQRREQGPSEDTALQTDEGKKEDENISLYNDELMPYSFRWWLHKTRLEHADTYQPYATAVWPQPHEGRFNPWKLDETILDQQIKENIIHFQDPEMKLSEAVKSKPVEVVEPKKSDEIIEKFIREEPIIHPPAPEQLNTANMARQSAEDNYMLVTETLANIYVEQGLYMKAVEVFKKLILRYPEKKSYFAARIQELEKNL